MRSEVHATTTFLPIAEASGLGAVSAANLARFPVGGSVVFALPAFGAIHGLGLLRLLLVHFHCMGVIVTRKPVLPVRQRLD